MFLVCGEALFDFFLESEAGPASATYAARAGGSPFNVAIGLTRLGQEAGLLTGLSSDLLGQRLVQVLEAEGVSTRYAIPTDRPTTLSLVGLDAAGVPAYQFYDNGSADTGVEAGDLPALGPEVIGLHFGSYSLAATPVGDAMAALARGKGGRFVSVDPNVRPTVEPDMAVWRARLDVLLPLADLVKISAEDLELLWPGKAAEAFAADLVAAGVCLVVVTDGGEAAHGWTCGGLAARATPPKVKVITPWAPATPSRLPSSPGSCAIRPGRRRRSPGWTRRGWLRSSTTPRGPPRSLARGAARICRGPPS